METADEITVEILASGVAVDDVRRALARHCSRDGIPVRFPPRPELQFRSAGPDVLVAVVGASSAAIGALITGLFALLKQRQTKRIVIRDGDRSVEGPLELLEEDYMNRLAELLGKMREMGRPEIHLRSSDREGNAGAHGRMSN